MENCICVQILPFPLLIRCLKPKSRSEKIEALCQLCPTTRIPFLTLKALTYLREWFYHVAKMGISSCGDDACFLIFHYTIFFFHGIISIVVHTNYSTKVYITSIIAYRSNCTNLQLLHHMGLLYIKLNCYYIIIIIIITIITQVKLKFKYHFYYYYYYLLLLGQYYSYYFILS